MAASDGAKRERLNIRIKPEIRGLIDRAAELVGTHMYCAKAIKSLVTTRWRRAR